MDPHDGYWSEPFPVADCAQMAVKYARLLRVVRDKVRSRRDPALREIAAAWPGALRECQLVAPPDFVGRLRAARLGADDQPRPRSRWRERGLACIPLWADLHRLLADQLAWRRSGRRGELVELVRASSVEARSRWPDEAVSRPLVAGRPTQHTAYAALAARADLDVASLRELLFGGRSGGRPTPVAG